MTHLSARAEVAEESSVMRHAARLAADIQHAAEAAPAVTAPPLGETRTAMLRGWCERQDGTFDSGVAARALGLRREFCANMFREWRVEGYLVASGTLNCGQSHGTVLYRRKA